MKREVIVIVCHLKEVGLVLGSSKGPVFGSDRKVVDYQLTITLFTLVRKF